MATYASLSQEQKDTIQSFTNNLRTWAGEQARANRHASAFNDQYNAQASAIVASLDAGEVVPNTSSLDGAGSVTKEELVSVTAHIQNILADMSSHTAGFDTDAIRQLWTKFGGAVNMIG